MSLSCKLIGMVSDEERAAGDALQEAKNWRSRTRAVRHGYWFPLVMFGLLTLAAAPLFWAKDLSPCPHGEVTCTFSVTGGPLGNPFAQSPLNVGLGRWISLYWVLAVPLGYVATVFYYRHRARRTGVAGRVWPAVVVGLALSVLMVGSFESRGWLHLPGHPTWGLPVPILLLQGRGLDPLLVIGIGVGILARLERSRALAVFAGMFFALALLANLYDLQNQVYRLGWHLPAGAGYLPNVVLPGLFLLVGGIGFWWADRRVLHRVGGNP
jgi:hypothetical protein